MKIQHKEKKETHVMQTIPNKILGFHNFCVFSLLLLTAEGTTVLTFEGRTFFY